ncbi:MAG: MmcQ/YjbR family DNA-binding protein [Chitinophagaceae bacterium]|nr:MmcQ/YjbR family DNA-binding protein [Chitinophagaceae bacterium]
MNIETLQKYCLSKNGVEETLPFGPETLVYKVHGKIFLLCGMDSSPFQFNVKCDPDRAIELREEYASVQPGYHMNKKHWNTVIVDGSVGVKLLNEWIDHSYDLVVKSLPKKIQEEMNKKV